MITPASQGFYCSQILLFMGLEAQGRTATEALKIARDAARKLIDALRVRSRDIELLSIGDSFDYPLIVSA